MKTLLRVIMILSGIALVIGIILYVEAAATPTTADNHKLVMGAGIIGASLLPFITSLGFCKIVDMLEDYESQKEKWLESINYNLLEIRNIFERRKEIIEKNIKKREGEVRK